VAPPEPVLYKLCKPGWAVIVERIANAQGTRFVCPFCPKSHRVLDQYVDSEDAASTMEPLAASGGIGNRWHAH